MFLYHCISNFGCHFHFILHVISDKAAFVSGALFCVQRYRGNLEIINLHIYTATNSASLWDHGRNNFNGNSFSAIHVIMLELKNNKHNTYYRSTYLYLVNAVIFKLLLTTHLKRDLATKKPTITLPL